MTAADVVLVVGPPRAGVTAMTAELRRRMPDQRFVEAGDAGPPALVVFVVSAVAPVTESDCATVDSATWSTDVVVAVVAKVDDHRDWGRVLEADRERLAARAPRFGRVPWVGAAAAPRLGEPVMDELVALLRSQLADPALAGRNAQRAAEARERALRSEREQLARDRRAAALELRSDVAQARLAVTHAVRRRCARLRADLLDDAAAAGRRDVPGFADRARRHAAEVLARVDEDVDAHTRAVTGRTGSDMPGRPVPEPVGVPDPPLRARRLETRLMTVLGAGFGVGVAMVVTRLLSGLAPGLATAGAAVGVALGIATAAWVVRARALLHERAVLERWSLDAAAAVRAAAEERVAARMLTLETSIGRRIAEVETEIRALSRAQSRPIGQDCWLPVGRPRGESHLNRSCE
ncbi:hypothetical protein C6A87_001265 [Mycobacterium sp. ITM-2016-00317]|uniref:hypothetical protein n=1 Tax=Mycobacterium sp. ITM-2016-00317 TaxID=2099694 RepID=UPI00287F585A|nr:hypothetical protein [Mycobacterium sp. ITM-2016-00317]WNG87942.1 hypothetical protein C6A87_001265 [Mycobacterium sp. ITM-2016-00317]